MDGGTQGNLKASISSFLMATCYTLSKALANSTITGEEYCRDNSVNRDGGDSILSDHYTCSGLQDGEVREIVDCILFALLIFSESKHLRFLLY